MKKQLLFELVYSETIWRFLSESIIISIQALDYIALAYDVLSFVNLLEHQKCFTLSK